MPEQLLVLTPHSGSIDMAAEPFLTHERIRRFLEGTEDGTVIVVTYRNANDPADKSPRTARGTLLRTPPTWTVTRSSTSRVSFHQNAKIISVTIPSTSRTISRDDPTSDPDESDEDTGVVEVWHFVPMSATTAPPTSVEGGVDLRQL